MAGPVKPLTGVKVTWPAGLTVQLPAEVVTLVCWPGALGSRSTVLGSRVWPLPGVSLAGTLRVTGTPTVVAALSSAATNPVAVATVTRIVAVLEVFPASS